MNFSLKRYIALLVFIILCIGITIPLASTDINASQTNMPAEDIIVPEIIEDPISDAETTTPIFRNAFSCYEYANNLLINGKGHDASIYSAFNAQLLSGAVSGEFYIYYDSKRNGNENYENVITTCEFDVVDSAYRHNYQKDGIVYLLDTKNINKDNAKSIKEITPNWTNEKVRLHTLDDYNNNVYKNGFNLIPFNINRSTAKQDFFKTDNKYYSFSFTNNINTLPERYTTSFSNIGVTELKFTSSSLSCIVNKRTGNFLSAVRTEAAIMTIKGFTLNVKATTSYNFKSINQEVEIVIPDRLKVSDETLNNWKTEKGLI